MRKFIHIEKDENDSVSVNIDEIITAKYLNGTFILTLKGGVTVTFLTTPEEASQLHLKLAGVICPNERQNVWQQR